MPAMNAIEYQTLAAVELQHWWCLAQRDIFTLLLRRYQSPGISDTVLDIGCGTGGHLRWLRETLPDSQLWGLELSPAAAGVAAINVPSARILSGQLEYPPHELPASFSLLLCSDVLYAVPDETAALRGLQMLCQRLLPGGLLLLHEPALSWLTSRHDRQTGGIRRFTQARIAAILQELRLQPLMLTYRMCLLLPALLMHRLPSILCPSSDRTESGPSSLRLPPRLLNRMLLCVTDAERVLLKLGCRLPIGSSLIAVGRKPC